MSSPQTKLRHELLGLNLEEYRRLPHPTRLKEMLAEFVRQGKDDANITATVNALKSPHQSIADVAELVYATSPDLAYSIASNGPQFLTVFSSTAVPLRHHVGDGRLFTVGSELSEILFNTEVSDDVPCKMLRLPFPNCYLHFPEALTECSLLTTEGEKVRMLGCYAQECTSEEAGQGSGKETRRALMLTFIGEGDASDPDDDTLRFLTLDLSQADEKLSTVLAASFERMKNYDKGLGFSKLPGYFASYENAMHHIVRVLLYMNCASVRMEAHKPASELQTQITRVGPAKQPKLKRKLARLFDYIEICPPRIERPTGTGDATAGHARTTHWRRGHLRNQAHGPQHSLRKLIFLPPTVVSGANKPDAAGVRNYQVS